MENFLYEQNYEHLCPDLEDLDDLVEDDEDDLSEPRMVLTARFHDTLRLCDAYAKRNYGQIYAKIDFQTYEAEIRMLMPTFDFAFPEDCDLLTSLRAMNYITFQPHPDGGLEMVLMPPCFLKLR